MLEYLLSIGNKKNLEYEQVQKLIASDGSVNARFGTTVSISYDKSVICVGLPYDVHGGLSSGSAYIYIRQQNGSYSQTQKLLAADRAANDRFGMSLAVSSDGSFIIVGANTDTDNGISSGSAYVYTRPLGGAYVQTQKLRPTDGSAYGNFGKSVVVSEDASTLIISKYGDSSKGSYTGAVYVFTKQENNLYTQTQKITAFDAATGDYFGDAIALSTNKSTLVIGAYGDDAVAPDSGSAYIYVKQPDNSYVLAQKVMPLDGADSDRFGNSVAISEDGVVVIIGAWCDNDQGADSGSVYVFIKQNTATYEQIQKLVSLHGITGTQFGKVLSMSDDANVLVVGAATDSKNSYKGVAYVLTKQDDNTYLHSHELLASDGAVSDIFSSDLIVSRDGSTVIVGAAGDDDMGSASGSVYVFKR